MDNEQIELVLLNDPYTRPVFQAVCPKDQLTYPYTDPAAYVVNLDDSRGPGTHWVALFIHQSKGEANYFDSLGQAPIAHVSPLLKLCPSIKTNRRALQDHTMVCGQFSIMFLLLRARGYTFQATLNILDHPLNDHIMYQLFQPVFPFLPFYPSVHS